MCSFQRGGGEIRKDFRCYCISENFSSVKEFIIFVAAANIIAWPAAYYFMSKWLENFVFRTHIQMWMFLFSAVIAFVIAFLLVTYKTINAATANPVDSLRYE